MMAMLMCRLLVEACSLLVACTVCPIQCFMGDTGKAVATLAMCYVVGRMVALSVKEKADFDRFVKQPTE